MGKIKDLVLEEEYWEDVVEETDSTSTEHMELICSSYESLDYQIFCVLEYMHNEYPKEAQNILNEYEIDLDALGVEEVRETYYPHDFFEDIKLSIEETGHVVWVDGVPFDTNI